MRLKKIKLAGFKSFVDPTTIPFPDDMTAVVGPNGCGKSNVIDAVRWVLGESSAKNLRGDSMTDVIFNGSTARKPVSQCSVELVFDNSSGRIQGEYAGYNELSVKRIVTKDAQSSYLLNNTKCRRRDVTDLFLGTGLGPRSYAIIEQGMISRLIESKPQELRVFIEEAAGVSKYKERRRETETRIRHTKENLERLEDVRGELGQQLEKLQRQATAAKRYKELKQNERRYKAELAAIRWLKHSKKIDSLESDISKKDADIEAYVATQRNEEKDITEFKQQQQDFKQQLSDIQQQVFRVSTDITRIEQNQIHTKQRRQQIEQESNSLQEAITDNEIHHQQNLDKIEELSEQIALAEPEKQLSEDQLEQAQSVLLEAEEQFSQQQHQWRNKELEFNQRKQQAQSCHGKIQSLMSMQMRTQQRIGELKDELSEVIDDELTLQIETCQDEILILEEQAEQSAENTELTLSTQETSQVDLKQAEQNQMKLRGELQSIEAQLAALNALQQSSDLNKASQDFIQKYQLTSQSWWQTLDIQNGWEEAFETITQQWQSAVLLPQSSNQDKLVELSGSAWLFQDSYIENHGAKITDKSIVTKLNNKAVPSWLTHILCANNLEQGLAMLTNLASYQSVITQDGYWLGQGWMIVGSADQQSGLLKRANQIKQLEAQLELVQSKILAADVEVSDKEDKLIVAKRSAETAKQQFEQLKLTLQQTKNQAQLLAQQHQQNMDRNTRLSQELIRQQDTSEEEQQQQLEELAMQAEELEQAVEALQEQQLEFELNREQLQQKVADSRTQVENTKNKLHQLALHLQSVQSQYQGLTANQQREALLLNNMQQKLSLLKTEFAELSSPLEDQQESLQQLLEQKAMLDIQQQELHDKLAAIDEKLTVAEKGQQGVTDKIQLMLSELQSIKLECEGYRVRANGVLEQLQEMHQNLKEVLDTLPEDANETSWQNLLDKTIASVGRLGAVNLAAVEEYDIQAERKQHLDDQNDDLVSALDILEQAIRKIDKETRSRFKETFDQVNEDLKLLFPKVFGGGMAYLELTGDDLLETGVTIMARPPGKKNSTIHLLSGGEKALTALSLVFAIFRLNPAPFCLLDEVDAPLDDANVVRFCKLVSEMSKTVQFIFITHNKIAMEMATHLTGVTMAEPGVSRMVAVDVDEAVAIAQA
ncbi:chromosome segregation protein SMC [Paraglaciecola arctica]|uniref:Chromosome partition protein Smc n=1 Tax=Paraglaciecola arctica BSs20135 TaxID=493475 RepID=K6YHB1_9ALTE|nr:chromosome segregation protein SMC [Paraglaciecola arctica]GAC17562.1 chromosome segregation protein [Paraglaciecola arctica BSs20135]